MNVVAVIVTHDGSDWIDGCLSSVLAGCVDKVIVVDNCSHDDTVQKVKAFGDGVELLLLPINEGFGRANNRGIQVAIDSGARYVCLFNQDVTVCHGAVDRMIVLLESHAEYAAVSSLQLRFNEDSIDPLFRQYYLPAEFWDDLFFRSARDLYEVTRVPGTAVAIRVTDLKCVGGFDPLFFMYGEDDDLCDRIRAAGRKIGIAPHAIVRHWHGHINRRGTVGSVVNKEYSSLILRIKRSTRPLPCAYVEALLQSDWHVSPFRATARIIGFLRALLRVWTVSHSRKHIPYSFSAP